MVRWFYLLLHFIALKTVLSSPLDIEVISSIQGWKQNGSKCWILDEEADLKPFQIGP